MIRSPTVLVIGAGASVELGFPSGSDLLKQLSNDLDIRFEWNEQKHGSRPLMEAYRQDHRERAPDSDLNAYLHAGRRIRDAAAIARSIDNAIDQNNDNPLIEVTGKLAIALAILSAEQHSKLSQPRNTGQGFDLSRIRQTWLFHLGQIITTDVQKSAVESIFEQLTIINFNYDRSVEAFLPLALVQAYGMSADAAQALAAKIVIFHPYGSVGRLPWQRSPELSVDYGSYQINDVVRVAAGLKTFTERLEDSSDLMHMRNAMAVAENVVFLGFGYHRQNMTLISPPKGGDAQRVIGTVFGEPAPAINQIRDELSKMMGSGVPPAQLESLTCADFMAQQYRAITS